MSDGSDTNPTMERRARLLLRIPEVAEVLGVSRSKVYELIALGDLPHVRLGARCIRVPADLLATWVEGRR